MKSTSHPPLALVACLVSVLPLSAHDFHLLDGATPTQAGVLSSSPGAVAATDTVPSAGGVKHDLAPHNPLTYTIGNLSGTYVAGGQTQFVLFADAYNHGQTSVQARVSYDFTGDGTWDRVDTYRSCALNNITNWEQYTEVIRDGLQSSTGAFAHFTGGRIKFEIWSALGNWPIDLRTGVPAGQPSQSRLIVPFNFGATPPADPGSGTTGGTGATGGTGSTGGTGTGGTGGTTPPDPAPPAGPSLPERFRTLLGNLGEGSGASSQSATISFPESLLAPANDPAFGTGFSAANALPQDQLVAKLAQGLEAWRRPGTHGSCVSCHSPDAFDLALIGYSNADITRRALDHVSAEDASRIVELVRAMRQLYTIERPLHPLTFRPLQPGMEVLPGDTAEQRDLAFAQVLGTDVNLLWASGRIESREQALAAQAQLRSLDLRKLPVGIPFDRWSEDAARGAGHQSAAEWLPGMGVMPKAGRAAEWHALHDDYILDPSDAKFWAYFSRIDELLESVEPAGFPLGYKWSVLKYKSVQVAQHMLRHRSLCFPNPLVDRTGGLVANRSLVIDRNPLFRTGDHVRRFPLHFDSANASTTFPAFVAGTLPTDQGALRQQNEQFARAWFWMGWVYDPALLVSDTIFQTVEGDYLYASLLQNYKIHHAFVVAKTSVAKAGATAWFNASGPGVAGHGKWASFTPFMVLHHIERNRNEPPAGDPRRAAHDRMFANTARLWIHLVHEDLERTGTVYDRYLVRSVIRFVRPWLDQTEPGVNHAAIDAVIAQIEQLLNQAQELRTDFTGDDLPGGLPV
jgi:hypothetical protein